MQKYLCIKKWSFCLAMAAQLVCTPISALAGLTQADAQAPFHPLSSDKNYILKPFSNNNFIHRQFSVFPSFGTTKPPVKTTATHKVKKPLTALKKILNYLNIQTSGVYDQNGKRIRDKDPYVSSGGCARSIRLALQKGGMYVRGANATAYLNNLPDTTPYVVVPHSKYNVAYESDIAVIEGSARHPDGHVAMLAAHHWKADLIHRREVQTGKRLSAKERLKVLRAAYPYAEPFDPSKVHIFRNADLVPQTASPYNAQASYSYAMPSFVEGYLSYMNTQTDARILHGQQETFFNAVLASLKPPSTVAPSEHAQLSNKAESHLVMESPNGTAALVNPTDTATRGNIPFVPVTAKGKGKNIEDLLDQWHAARVEVLKRNASLKNGELDQTAHNKLRRHTLNMFDCLPDAYDQDILTTFKAARYVFNKLDLFAEKETKGYKDAILKQMADHLDKIADKDAKLGGEAARFIFKNAGKGALRERVRNHPLRQAVLKPYV